MKCDKCGANLVQGAKFCTKCGFRVNDQIELEEKDISYHEKNVLTSSGDVVSEGLADKEKTVQKNIVKEWNDRKTIFVLIGVFVIAILTGSVIKIIGRNKNQALPSQQQKEIVTDVSGQEDVGEDIKTDASKSDQSTNIDENGNAFNTPEVAEAENNGIKAEIEKIIKKVRKTYDRYISKKEAGKFIKRKEPGIRAYYAKNQLRIVEVDNGVDGSSYSHFYYYNDKGLFFAYYEGDEDASRLYFEDGKLIRWRYSPDYSEPDKAENHDKEDSEAFESWERKVLKDSDMTTKGLMKIDLISKKDIVSISSSSELSERGMTHSASRIADGSLAKAWVEGKSGQGIGERVVFRFDEYHYVRGMNIFAGYQKSRDLYYKNSRPKKLKLTFSDQSSKIIHLADKYGSQNVKLDSGIITKEITVEIQSVYKGHTYTDTVISEIEFY